MVCIEKVSRAIELVVVGIRDREFVCHLDGVFVGSVYFESARPDWTAKALDAFGWANAPRQTRVRIATLWVEEVVFAFTAKSKRAFRGSANDDGTIKVIVSVRLPPGITSRSAPKILSFDANGKMFGAENY